MVKGFEVGVIDPDRPWRSHNALIFSQNKSKVRIRERVGSIYGCEDSRIRGYE
jgi:hypothetical protein